ncbi:hypothetical protein CHUAL_011602 [Chamberlinius hualienensis]
MAKIVLIALVLCSILYVLQAELCTLYEDQEVCNATTTCLQQLGYQVVNGCDDMEIEALNINDMDYVTAILCIWKNQGMIDSNNHSNITRQKELLCQKTTFVDSNTQQKMSEVIEICNDDYSTNVTAIAICVVKGIVTVCYPEKLV